MKVEIDVPEYSEEKGLCYTWEDGFTIDCIVENNTAVIKANREGLISLARHILMLAKYETPLGCHIHLDDMNSLEDGSCELVISKI